MNREEISKKIQSNQRIDDSSREWAERLVDSIFNEIEILKKENTRLKKQLSKGHHIECSCSFCKPVDEKVLKDFTFTSCDDCKNKIDGTYQEICSNCKRFYGCYFEAKNL